MKKVLSIVAVAAMMLFVGKANAQLSIHAGYQDFSVTSKTPLGSDTDSKGGFYVGGSYNMEAGAGLAVAPGLYFAYVEDVMDLRVPILINYGISLNDVRLALFAGPQINFGVAGDGYKDDGLVAVNRFDLGVSFGAQLSFKNISVEGGYTVGMLNRWKDAPSDCSVNTNQIFFGVGYAL